MVREHLSERLKTAGRELLAVTDELDMQAQGAMWLYDHALNDWRYYLVTSLVDSIGRRKTYSLLLKAFDIVELPRELSIDDVYLGSPHDQLFQVVSRVIRINDGMAQFVNCAFNTMQFDGVIYRSVAEPPSVQQADRIEKRFTKRIKDLPRQRSKTKVATV